ncbi:MAG: sugar phosphate isomerase/epimerase [Bacteroidetes bacterium]|nr:sugar phosphate isomerase/epimerase [Bacteroidota bacterium]
MKNGYQDFTRRNFLKSAVLATAGLTTTAIQSHGFPAIIFRDLKSKSIVNGVRIGVITYSFRDLPDQSAEAVLGYIKDCGIHAVELMGGPAESFAGAPKNPVDMRSVFPLMRKRNEKKELTDTEAKLLGEAEAQLKAYRAELAQWRTAAPMNSFATLKKMFSDAGVEIYAFKPDAFGINNSDAEIDYGLRAAKVLGASHITLEHPSNDSHTLKLGTMAEKHGVRVGYHGHEQQTPTLWDTAIQQSKSNALNLDLGHYIAAGNTDARELIQRRSNKIVSMHVKDRKNKVNGGANLPWGEGDTLIVETLQLMKKNRYDFPATIELEYKVPDGSGSVAEVRKCLEYCIKALS